MDIKKQKFISHQDVGQTSPFNPRYSETIPSAWEYFLSTGQFPRKSPRAVICESWQRSKDIGINPNIEQANIVLSLEEIDERLQREQLGQAGVSVMKRLVQKFDGSEHVIVLADKNGHILHSVGHRQIQNELDQIKFMPGANWSEVVVGPNGIGTPLNLQHPEVVMGYEHYCRWWQPWVCYGAPILDAGKNIIGVVDITGPVQKANQETMILTISVAQSVHYGIKLLHMCRREKLRSLSKETMHRWNENGVLLIDEDGYIIDNNNKALRFFKDDLVGILNRSLDDLIPGIWDTVHARISRNAYGEVNIDLMGEFGIKRPVQIHIEPISKGDECYGAVLVLTGSSVSRAESRQNKQSSELQSKYNFENIRGKSRALLNAVKLAKTAAIDPLESGVLLIGETGTGKELIAHSIHAESKRNKGPFIAINCGALPRDLIESELFGYVPGAFTGARREGMVGKFEAACNGTLFLDEIDSLDVALQAKFLRVLDDKEITRLGNNISTSVNVRIIAAASKDLHQKIEQEQFRLDLYHRLSVIEIQIPALRVRDNDVIDLGNIFLEEECWYANRGKLVLSDEVKPYLLNYQWPGNIRELYNLCLRWVLTVDGEIIKLDHLPDKIRQQQSREVKIPRVTTQESLKAVNDEIIKQVLEQTGGNITKAAQILGINRTTIYRRLKKQQD